MRFWTKEEFQTGWDWFCTTPWYFQTIIYLDISILIGIVIGRGVEACA